MDVTCETMSQIATYKPLSIVLLLLLIISFFGIPMLIFLIKKIISNSLYHINTRIILITHCIFVIAHLINRILLHASDLYRFLIIYPNKNSGCDILLNSTNCLFYRLIFNYGIWFSGTTAPCIIIERFIATRYPTSYHKDRKIGVILTIVQFFGTVGILSMTYFGYVFDAGRYYCMTARPHRDMINSVPLITVNVLQISSFLGLFLLKKYNLSLKSSSSGGELTKRYQIEETLRSLRTLKLPIKTMFISQMIFTTITFYYQRYASEINQEFFFAFSEAIVLLPEYSIIFVFTFVKIENRINIDGITSLKQGMDIDPDTYFKQYKNHW
ncbi:unnamed protein product [Caenorhabditis angaria]|uniref:Uncharacterized protein n=1 Tax=Caenorhabditis angaria TaxID=860376 RepID=A0A9P1N258_9PELO|nr:unnamed protein product [Caenorhabditis angaria]